MIRLIVGLIFILLGSEALIFSTGWHIEAIFIRGIGLILLLIGIGFIAGAGWIKRRTTK